MLCDVSTDIKGGGIGLILSFSEYLKIQIEQYVLLYITTLVLVKLLNVTLKKTHYQFVHIKNAHLYAQYLQNKYH